MEYKIEPYTGKVGDVVHTYQGGYGVITNIKPREGVNPLVYYDCILSSKYTTRVGIQARCADSAYCELANMDEFYAYRKKQEALLDKAEKVLLKHMKGV